MFHVIISTSFHLLYDGIDHKSCNGSMDSVSAGGHSCVTVEDQINNMNIFRYFFIFINFKKIKIIYTKVKN